MVRVVKTNAKTIFQLEIKEALLCCPAHFLHGSSHVAIRCISNMPFLLLALHSGITQAIEV